ncbi:MAG TPA: ATP-binding protein [Usitatibacter sp.]|jgi:signal transduction histidine kinase/ActR/RegA family two-component response regulator|nr:ATP-binding protein [Usitatibacter sp.]
MTQPLPRLPLRNLLFGLGALIVSINILSAAWDLRNSRGLVERAALRDFSNLSSLLADQTARSLEAVTLLLHQAAIELDRDGMGDPMVRSQRLRDRISGFPRVRALLVLDRRGHIMLSTDERSVLDMDVSDRQYFRRQRDERIEGAFVSEPFMGRIRHRWSFALSERLTDSHGAFAGVVAAIIDIEYVDRLYRSLDLGQAGFISLWNRDGHLVTRIPPRPELYAVNDASRVAERLHAPDYRFSGWNPDLVDASRLLLSSAPVPQSPLVVVVGAKEDQVLAPWREEALRVTVRTVVTSLLMVLLVWLAARELTRREATERLARLNEHRLQQRLRQAEKMEAVGRLAGGIAHDFNNILGGISGYAEMLLEDLPEGSTHHRYAAKLLSAARRARDLVEQILTYSRTHRVARKAVDLGRIARETLDVVRGSIPRGIVVECAAPPTPMVTSGDATQLHQVVMNLCTNAIQAMPEGGTLRLSLEALTLTHPLALPHADLAPGDYVRLTVRDTGVGMDETTLAHIFEPFFTTKETGRGTGLGLALVFGIVVDSGGGIAVSSQPRAGTAFEIYLPRISEVPLAEKGTERATPRGAGERVLLVDDEMPLLAMMSELLQRLGYEPEPFADPKAALAAFEAQPSAYDAILTDEAMPELSGTALAARVRRARSDIPILIVTGHAEEGFREIAAQAGVREVLLKPVAQRDLAEALARQLAVGATH